MERRSFGDQKSFPRLNAFSREEINVFAFICDIAVKENLNINVWLVIVASNVDDLLSKQGAIKGRRLFHTKCFDGV